MKKFAKQLLTGVFALGLLAPVATSVTANNPLVRVNASSWHYGVPRAIKGKWISSFIHVHHGYYKNFVGVSKAKYGFNPFPHWYNSHKHYVNSGATAGGFWDPHYKYVGHNTYKLICGGRSATSHSLRNDTNYKYHEIYTFHMHGHNHFSAWYWDHYDGHSYVGYFNRVHHL